MTGVQTQVGGMLSDAPSVRHASGAIGARAWPGAALAGLGIQAVGDDVNLANAAEEMAAFFSEAAALRKEDTVEAESELLPSAMDIEALWRALGGGSLGDSEAKERVLQLLAQAESGRPLIRPLRSGWDDPSRQYLLLAAAYRLAQRPGLGTAVARHALADALDTFEQVAGPAARAGTNTVAQAQAFSPVALEQEDFRAAYRGVVLDTAPVAATVADRFKQVLARFGEERFDRGVQLLLAAAASDMNAPRPSDGRRLHAALSEISLLQCCATVLSGVRALAAKWQQAGVRAAPAAVAGVLAELCDLHGPSKRLFDQMPQKFKVPAGEPSRVFLAGILGEVRRMPEKLFESPEHRIDTIAAAQLALDHYNLGNARA